MQNKMNQAMMPSRIQNVGWLVFLWVLVIGLAGAGPAGAVGFRLPNQDPEAIARGDAYAATADNPSAIYYNPAGITQIPGYNIRAGIYAISASTDYHSPTGTASTDNMLQAVPQFYFVDSLTNVPLSIGLGLYAPYGLSLDYGNHAPFNTVAERGSLIYLSLNPVIAWRVHRTLSIGIGPTINYSQASFARAIGLIPGDQFSYHGDAMSYGFNAGILWQPHRMWSFGVNYRSATQMNYDGNISTTPHTVFPRTASSSAGINFPQFAVAGISFRPTTNWNLEADLDWTDFNSVQKIQFQDKALGNPSLNLDYRDSFIYEFGVTRQLGQGYFASVGYIYSQNSSPDANYTPLIPDADLSLGSIGFGRHGKHWDWAVAYHFAFYADRDVQHDSNAAADGNYRTYNNAINISGTYKF